jgi:hypothetical protein
MEHIWEEKEKRSTKLDPHPIINRLGDAGQQTKELKPGKERSF